MSSGSKVSMVLLLLAVSFVLNASGHLNNCTAVNSTYVVCTVSNGTWRSGGGGGRHKGRGRGMISGLLKLAEAENVPNNDMEPRLTDGGSENGPKSHL